MGRRFHQEGSHLPPHLPQTASCQVREKPISSVAYMIGDVFLLILLTGPPFTCSFRDLGSFHMVALPMVDGRLWHCVHWVRTGRKKTWGIPWEVSQPDLAGPTSLPPTSFSRNLAPWPHLTTGRLQKQSVCPGGEENRPGEQQASVCHLRSPLCT